MFSLLFLSAIQKPIVLNSDINRLCSIYGKTHFSPFVYETIFCFSFAPISPEVYILIFNAKSPGYEYVVVVLESKLQSMGFCAPALSCGRDLSDWNQRHHG